MASLSVRADPLTMLREAIVKKSLPEERAGMLIFGEEFACPLKADTNYRSRLSKQFYNLETIWNLVKNREKSHGDCQFLSCCTLLVCICTKRTRINATISTFTAFPQSYTHPAPQTKFHRYQGDVDFRGQTCHTSRP